MTHRSHCKPLFVAGLLDMDPLSVTIDHVTSLSNVTVQARTINFWLRSLPAVRILASIEQSRVGCVRLLRRLSQMGCVELSADTVRAIAEREHLLAPNVLEYIRLNGAKDE